MIRARTSSSRACRTAESSSDAPRIFLATASLSRSARSTVAGWPELPNSWRSATLIDDRARAHSFTEASRCSACADTVLRDGALAGSACRTSMGGIDGRRARCWPTARGRQSLPSMEVGTARGRKVCNNVPSGAWGQHEAHSPEALPCGCRSYGDWHGARPLERARQGSIDSEPYLVARGQGRGSHSSCALQVWPEAHGSSPSRQYGSHSPTSRSHT